ncbi:MAG: hypothetical protein U0073_03085 [Bacteroidia bacterium]
MKNLLLSLLLISCLSLSAQTPTSSSSEKSMLSLELDPAPFILGGYSFSLKYSPAQLSHFSIMASVYSSEFPDNMMSKSNFDKGFRDLKLETSFAVFADYFFRPDRKGLHFGPSVFFYSKSVGHLNSTERIHFNSRYPNLRAGYVFKPFKNVGFYLNPWVNFGKEFGENSNAKSETLKFTQDKFSYIVAIHFGYAVNF